MFAPPNVYDVAQPKDDVMVAGKWTVEDANPMGVDLVKLRADHGQAFKVFA